MADEIVKCARSDIVAADETKLSKRYNGANNGRIVYSGARPPKN